MKNKHLVPALSAAVILLMLALAFVLGRQSGVSQPPAPINTARPVNVTPAPAKAAPHPVIPQGQSVRDTARAQDARHRRAIVGYWANGECDTDNGEHFAANGTYEAYETRGRWTIMDAQLSVTITHAQQDPEAGLGEGEITPVADPRPAVSRILEIGLRRMVRIADGRRMSQIRCRNRTV